MMPVPFYRLHHHVERSLFQPIC